MTVGRHSYNQETYSDTGGYILVINIIYVMPVEICPVHIPVIILGGRQNLQSLRPLLVPPKNKNLPTFQNLSNKKIQILRQNRKLCVVLVTIS
jgi:hypothetical protein